MIKLLQRKRQSPAVEEPGKAIVLSLNSTNRGLDFLVEVVKKIRPKHPQRTAEAELRFRALLFQLQEDKGTLFALRKSFLSQFLKSNLLYVLTESGIVSSRGFVQELGNKLKH